MAVHVHSANMLKLACCWVQAQLCINSERMRRKTWKGFWGATITPLALKR